ncbi:hypothetical protein LEMLEM_LOCUS19165 [Lemmus lemmus]
MPASPVQVSGPTRADGLQEGPGCHMSCPLDKSPLSPPWVLHVFSLVSPCSGPGAPQGPAG